MRSDRSPEKSANGIRFLLGSVGHLAHILHRFFGQVPGLLQSLDNLLDNLVSFLNRSHRILNESLCGLRRFIRFGRQVTDFIGHNRKALAGSAGTRGLNGSIQSQNIGLESDILDGGNDICNLLGRVGNVTIPSEGIQSISI